MKSIVFSLTCFAFLLLAACNNEAGAGTEKLATDTALVIAPVKPDTTGSVLHDSTGTNTSGRAVGTDTTRMQR